MSLPLVAVTLAAGHVASIVATVNDAAVTVAIAIVAAKTPAVANRSAVQK
jgi:hypothetical protein